MASSGQGLDGLVVGIVGTGMMATGHAVRWAKLGLPVIIASRDPSRAQRLAARVGGKARAATHAEMVAQSTMILLCTPATARPSDERESVPSFRRDSFHFHCASRVSRFGYILQPGRSSGWSGRSSLQRSSLQ